MLLVLPHEGAVGVLVAPLALDGVGFVVAGRPDVGFERQGGFVMAQRAARLARVEAQDRQDPPDVGPARVAAEKAIELDPKAVTSWDQLGVVHLARIGRRQKLGYPIDKTLFQDALAVFRKVDKLKGGSDPRARLEIGEV